MIKSEQRINKYILLILFAIIFIIPINSVYANLNLGNSINLFDYCEKPIMRTFITQPCSQLITPDGHSLTDEGVNVLGCLGGDALMLVFGAGTADKIGMAAVGCTPGSSNVLGNNVGSTTSSSNEHNGGFLGTGKPLVDLSGHNGPSVLKNLYCSLLC
jgi:hypothetical protein